MEEADRLFRVYSPRVYGFCLTRLRSREEAEDAVQTTFLNAWRSLQNGAEPRFPLAWLLTIAQNVCISRIRAAARTDPLPSSVAEPTHERGDDLVGLADALGTLSEHQLRAILLREWKGLSYREIGAELDLSEPAVETLLFRARRSLARALDRERARAA